MAAPVETPYGANSVTLYAKQADGTITPVHVDANGNLVAVLTTVAGQLNSDASPLYVAPTNASLSRFDVPMQTLLTLRVIARLLQETLVMNQGGGAIPDDIDAMINDE